MMETRSGELSNTCPVRYSARFRSVMSVMVTSTRSNRADGCGNVIVNSAVSVSPFRLWRTVSASKDVRPSAMAISSRRKTSWVSGTKTLCSETRSSSLLSAANNLTDTSLTSTILTIVMACWTNSGCAAKYSRKSRTPLDLSSSIATLTWRSEEHTSELQSLAYLVCRLLLEKKKKTMPIQNTHPISIPSSHQHNRA